MYNRAFGQRRPPIIPDNYSGVAFGAPPPPPEDEKEPVAIVPGLPAPPPPAPPSDGCCDTCNDSPPKREPKPCQCPPDIGSQLPILGIGEQDLLIIILILLISQGDDVDGVLPYLVLLLFC